MRPTTRVMVIAIVPVLALLLLAGIRELARALDDGPGDRIVDTLIDVLRAHGAHATFFLTGSELAESPEAGAKLVAAGHELGNHTYTHRRMIFVTRARVRREIERTDSLLRKAGQREPIWFRPPFGYKLFALPRYLESTSRTTVMWSIEPDSYPEVA